MGLATLACVHASRGGLCVGRRGAHGRPSPALAFVPGPAPRSLHSYVAPVLYYPLACDGPHASACGRWGFGVLVSYLVCCGSIWFLDFGVCCVLCLCALCFLLWCSFAASK